MAKRRKRDTTVEEAKYTGVYFIDGSVGLSWGKNLIIFILNHKSISENGLNIFNWEYDDPIF